jgi:hypothetical protein
VVSEWEGLIEAEIWVAGAQDRVKAVWQASARCLRDSEPPGRCSGERHDEKSIGLGLSDGVSDSDECERVV